MQFRDNVPGPLDQRGAQVDSTRDLAQIQDATLGDWFSRPINIGTFTWDVDSPLFERFNPWALFWADARNKEKLNHFHLLRHNLHVKFLINGNAFYYGRLIAAYEPLAGLDNTTPRDIWVPEDIIRGSQRLHVYINPTQSQGGSMLLPFFWPQNNWEVGQSDWNEMGDIVLSSINDLKHANDGIEPLTITVMAWAENVKMAIPTRSVPEAGVPESTGGDEHNQDIISRPATNVARIAGALSKVPTIGPYAKATEMGARAVATTAKLFGLSAPNDLSNCVYEPHAKHSIAVTDQKQSAHKVTVDSKQELTIDPATTGIDPIDELPIASIAGRESFLTKFSWGLSDGVGQHLWNSRVDPGLHDRNGSEYHFTACAVAALPFQYWRGTMRFRFQVVASEYHKGRIRIVYDPLIGGSTSEFNSHYTSVHDIAEQKDFSIDVGWGQNVPYKGSIGWSSNTEFGRIPITVPSNFGNGILSVYVLNTLTVPGSPSDIEVNVFVSALDDFEVAAPNDNISYLKFRQPVDVTPPLGMQMPESGVPEQNDDDELVTPVADPPPADTMADGNLDTPDTTLVFMGETIASFRTLLKRAYLHETILLPEENGTVLVKYSRSAFPVYGGFVDSPGANNSMVTRFTDGRFYVNTKTTLLNYLGRAFAGWRGSVRWTTDMSSVSNGTSGDAYNTNPFKLSRRNDYDNGISTTVLSSELATNIPQSVNELDRSMDLYGTHLGTTHVNPIQTIEAPYLQNDRFKFPGTDDLFQPVQGPGWDLSCLYGGTPQAGDLGIIRTYCSAGEDLNFFFFNGMPPVYYETAYARDQGA